MPTEASRSAWSANGQTRTPTGSAAERRSRSPTRSRRSSPPGRQTRSPTSRRHGPTAPGSLDDRAEESWEPLLAIADLAGGDWPDRARRAAIELSGSGKEDDEAIGVWLLRDIRQVFEESGVDKLPSSELAAALCEIETSPWGDIRGKALDARGLARRLKRFKIRPRTIRLDDDTTAKGYPLEVFEDAFHRYLGDFNRHTDTTPMDTGIEADSQPSHVTDVKHRSIPLSKPM